MAEKRFRVLFMIFSESYFATAPFSRERSEPSTTSTLPASGCGECLVPHFDQAETALKGAGADDSVLLAHKNEAAELLANESSTSADAADLVNELTELLKPYQSTEAPTPSIPDSTTASKPNTTTAAKPATKPATTAKKPNTTATKVKLAKQTTKVKANGKKKIKVSWKKDKKASGYEITYSTKKSFKGKKTIVVKSNKTTSKVVKKLTSKKKYFVKVRSYKQVGKTKTYGAYSKVKTVKVK